MGLSPILPKIQPVTIDTMVNNNRLLLKIELNFVVCERSLTFLAQTNYCNELEQQTRILTFYYRLQRSWGKVIFSEEFCPRGGACMVGRHVWQGGVHCRGACVAGGVRGSGGVCGTHAPGRYYEIWSMSGRYASYWNAFLFDIKFLIFCFVLIY